MSAVWSVSRSDESLDLLTDSLLEPVTIIIINFDKRSDQCCMFLYLLLIDD